MAFQDIGTPAYCRFFYNGPSRSFIFSAHGIWVPAQHGMTRVDYTYHWYTQPLEPLSHSQYLSVLGKVGISAEPVDQFGPGSGSVANMLFVPLEPQLFTATARPFSEKISSSNPLGLSLLAFHGSSAVPCMSLHLLDKQLLPALKLPKDQPVHMIVCRSLHMKQVNTVVRDQVVVIDRTPWPNPFDSVTNDML